MALPVELQDDGATDEAVDGDLARITFGCRLQIARRETNCLEATGDQPHSLFLSRSPGPSRGKAPRHTPHDPFSACCH